MQILTLNETREYVINIHDDLPKLQVQFSRQITLIYTNFLIKTLHTILYPSMLIVSDMQFKLSYFEGLEQKNLAENHKKFNGFEKVFKKQLEQH